MDRNNNVHSSSDIPFEGKEQYELDIDRMVNEGLGGGYVTEHNGLIEETTELGKELYEEEVE